MKVCTKCKTEKRPEDFPKDRRNSTGLSSWCRECHREKSQQKENEPGYKEKRREAMRQRRKNPDFLAKEKQRRERNKETKRQKDRETRLTPKGRARNLWNGAKRRAAKRNEPFDLSIERVIKALEIGVCEYTGLEFDLEQKLRVGKGRSPLSPSIDRKDPLKPYSDDNVNVVCDWYNMAKGQLSPEQLIEYCKRLLISNGYEVN